MGNSPAGPEHVTVLLRRWREGDPSALDQVMTLLHAELRRLAAFHMRAERPDHTLQPTALVNEAYLRLAGLHEIEWRDRAHFFAMASRMMRRVLVDAARAREAEKRGPRVVRVTLDDAQQVEARGPDTPDVLALDAALTRLEAMDERKARIVELRFFGGLSVDDTAAVVGVSSETVARDWRTAKLWLRREISHTASP